MSTPCINANKVTTCKREMDGLVDSKVRKGVVREVTSELLLVTQFLQSLLPGVHSWQIL